MSNVIDYSIGFSLVEVEEIFAVQKKELLKTQSAYAEDGSSVNKRRLDECHAIIQNCQRALQKLDPVTYPPDTGNMMLSGFSGYMEK